LKARKRLKRERVTPRQRTRIGEGIRSLPNPPPPRAWKLRLWREIAWRDQPQVIGSVAIVRGVIDHTGGRTWHRLGAYRIDRETGSVDVERPISQVDVLVDDPAQIDAAITTTMDAVTRELKRRRRRPRKVT